MKLARKLFVVLLTVAVAITCLAMPSLSAADSDNLDEVIKSLKEYVLCEEYIIDNYDSYSAGNYKFNQKEEGFTAQFNAGFGNTNFVIEADENGNNLLKITTALLAKRHYVITFDETTSNIVVSFRIKTDDFDFGSLNGGVNNVNGARFEIVLTDPELGISKAYFAMDCHGYNAEDPENSSMGFKYLTYSVNDKGITVYEEKDLDIPVELSAWYDVEAIFNADNGTYSVNVADSKGNSANSGDMPLQCDSVSKMELCVNDVVAISGKYPYIGTVTWLDNMQVYEGTQIRSIKDKEAKIAEYILELDEYSKSGNISVKDAYKIADAYRIIFNEAGYVPASDNSKYAEVSAVIAKANEGYIYSTFAKAYTEFTKEIANLKVYDDRAENLAILDNITAVFSDENGYISDAALLELPGITADDVTAIAQARVLYEAEVKALDIVKYQSDAFIYYINFEYDPNNMDYNYMKSRRDFLNKLTDRDLTYVYDVAEGEKLEYVSVAQAEEVYTQLKAKIATIEENANGFIAASKVLSNTELDFATRYENYVVALAIYSDGVVDRNLDDSTYPGLVEAIAAYNGCTDIAPIIVLQENFINVVIKANAFTEYNMIVAALDSVATFMDDNTDEDVLEDAYPGIKDAKALYTTLRTNVSKAVEAANAYIAAVETIVNANGYSAKKTAVASATTLKALCTINGVDGMQEANEAYEKAVGELAVAEAYSATLISSVTALATETDFATRRNLIIVANNCLANAEDAISGVTAAKTQLTTLAAAFDAEVEAINTAFAGIIGNTSKVVSSYAGAADVFDASLIISD